MCVQFRSEQFISSTICGKWKIFQARKAWKELGLVEEQQINFDEFKRALDLLDITLLEPRAMRLFEATDLDQSECIGIIEFQVALMMNDGIQIPCSKNKQAECDLATPRCLRCWSDCK